MKKCTKCKEVKDFSKFPKKSNSKDGYYTLCKVCKNLNNKMYSRTKEGLLTKIYAHQKHKSKLRQHAQPTYTKEELKGWMFKNSFEVLYVQWKKSGYLKDLTPSIDRIDDYMPYSLDNIRLVTWQENNKKGQLDRYNGINNKVNKSVCKYDKYMNLIQIYNSISIAGRCNNINPVNISQACKGINKTAGGFKWKYKEGV